MTRPTLPASASVHRFSPRHPIPGLTDIAGLCEILLDRIPELAGECRDDRAMDAVCELEERTLHRLADTPAAGLGDVVLKVSALAARLASEGADNELPGGEAALLRSVLRDLVLITEAAPRAAA